ncbi:MAG: hypothetical protein ACREQH_00295, partial [Candidatus Binatus sp.]
CTNQATAIANGLNALITPVVFPQDAGDKIQGSGVSLAGSECNSGNNTGGNTGCTTSLRQGAFNVQPLIEAARKKSFFHNGSFNTLEDAISFYFSPTGNLIKSFRAPRGPEGGAKALTTLATTYFDDPSQTQQVLGTMGFFLRSLSAVYAIADCERLVDDTMTLAALKKPTNVQVLLCTGELDDVDRLIAGATVQPPLPSSYPAVQQEARILQPMLKHAAQSRNQRALASILSALKFMRHSIATITPDLP